MARFVVATSVDHALNWSDDPYSNLTGIKCNGDDRVVAINAIVQSLIGCVPSTRGDESLSCLVDLY